jgi:hypothetical protein
LMTGECTWWSGGVLVGVVAVPVIIKEGAPGGTVVVVASSSLLFLLLFLTAIELFLTGEDVKEEFDKDNPANKSLPAAPPDDIGTCTVFLFRNE